MKPGSRTVFPDDKEGLGEFRNSWSEYVRLLPRDEIVEFAPLASRIACRWIKASPDLSGREVCIFAAYEPDGRLLDFKKRYLASLKSEGFLVVLVLSCDDLRECPGGKGLDYVDAILLRENRGFDFAAWSLVMSLVPSAWDADLLVLANDSVFGPSASFSAVVDKVRDSEAVVTGLTESLECGQHIQSIFLAFKGEALLSPEFHRYWTGMRALWDKWDVVFHYETRLLSFCRSLGLSCQALFPVDPRQERKRGKFYNSLHQNWRELVSAGLPFVKVELLRDNPISADLGDWEEFLLENGFSERLVRHEIPEAFSRFQERRLISLDRYHSSSNVRKTRKGKYQWKALSSRASFSLDISRLPERGSGWGAFCVELETSGQGGNAGFLIQYGESGQTNTLLDIPYENNRLAIRIVYLEKPIIALKFIPVNGECRFTVRRIGYIPLTPRQAEMRLLDYLIESIDFRGKKTRSGLKAVLEKSALEQGVPMPEILLGEYTRELMAGRELPYHDWIRKAESGEFSSLQELHSRGPAFRKKTRISIIVLAENPGENSLEQTCRSILGQSYPWWELLIAPALAAAVAFPAGALAGCLAGDSRVRMMGAGPGTGAAVQLNRALEMAAGDFVMVVRQGDRLPEGSLYHFARKISEVPRASLLYCDEDRIGRDGTRFNPDFRTDWNPDLFLARDYIGNSAVLRKSLADEVSGFRPGFEGCGVYDLLLRCLPAISPEEVVHIPRILYHRRSVNGGAEPHLSEPDSGRISAETRAVEDYFKRGEGCKVKVEGGIKPGISRRVRYQVPEPAPLVSMVIPTRDQLGLISRCISSILEKTGYQNYEILIVNNQSREKATLKWLAKIQEENSAVRVIDFDLPFNFSAISNLGVEEARGSIIALLNNDVEVINSGWLEEMVSHAARAEIGCVGAKLYFPDGTLQHVGVITGNNGRRPPWHICHRDAPDQPDHLERTMTVRNYSAVTAAVMLVRKSVYQEVGGFDSLNLKVALNDVDFCLKVKAAGYRNLWTPYAELIHHESRSRGYETTPQQQRRYREELSFLQKKWGETLLLDPFCNRNLKQDGSSLSLAGGD